MNNTTIILKNISEEPHSVRLSPTGQKEEIEPREAKEFDRAWGKNYLSAYPELFKEETALAGNFEVSEDDHDKRSGIIRAFLKNIKVSKSAEEEVKKALKKEEEAVEDLKKKTVKEKKEKVKEEEKMRQKNIENHKKEEERKKVVREYARAAIKAGKVVLPDEELRKMSMKEIKELQGKIEKQAKEDKIRHQKNTDGEPS